MLRNLQHLQRRQITNLQPPILGHRHMRQTECSRVRGIRRAVYLKGGKERDGHVGWAVEGAVGTYAYVYCCGEGRSLVEVFIVWGRGERRKETDCISKLAHGQETIRAEPRLHRLQVANLSITHIPIISIQFSFPSKIPNFAKKEDEGGVTNAVRSSCNTTT